MASATDLSANQAGESLAKLATLTETPVSKVENLGSSINELSNNFATSSSEIVDSMLRASGAATQFGLSQTDIVAFSAALNAVSESSERAVLPDRAKLHAMDAAADRGIGEISLSSNTTCIELDEYRAKNLAQADPANEFVSELAVGTGTDSPEHVDRALTNEHVRTTVTETIPNGQDLTVRAFLSKVEGNDAGSDLIELGLYAGNYFLNHSLFSSIEKTSGKAINFEIRLTFNTA